MVRKIANKKEMKKTSVLTTRDDALHGQIPTASPLNDAIVGTHQLILLLIWRVLRMSRMLGAIGLVNNIKSIIINYTVKNIRKFLPSPIILFQQRHSSRDGEGQQQ